MRHLKTLVLTQSATLPKVLNWEVLKVANVETAIEKLHQNTYQVVAISKDLDSKNQNKLDKIVSLLFPEVIVVKYESAETLSKNIKQAYWSKNKPTLKRSYLDNSFEIQLANKLNL